MKQMHIVNYVKYINDEYSESTAVGNVFHNTSEQMISRSNRFSNDIQLTAKL